MKEQFRIRICSDLDYEKMVADICWNDNTVALLSQENGIDGMKIEIYPPPIDLLSWQFPIDEFLEILQSAKKYLIELKKNKLIGS